MEIVRVVSAIEHVETIARGAGVRERKVLDRLFGQGAWRKMKGIATIETSFGDIRHAEIHWYEAHGIGKRRFKVKRFLD